HYTYLKLRDRSPYASALVSVAVALRLGGDRVTEARIALGGVAHKPWRSPVAERSLAGERVSQAAFCAAAHALTGEAAGQSDSNFKIELARRAIIQALEQAANGTPQSPTDRRIV
ncbi:MAG: FAD binding domain-containing protein, partial [Steroidobacteraceae bacterium]